MSDDDPFALLGLPPRFDVDRAAVRTARMRRMASLHPDRIADPVAQAEAVREAARVNDACATLEDDERRANALLRLLGGPDKEDDRSLPDGFLVDMLETRERIETVLATGDAAQRAEVERWASEQRQAHRDAVADLFATRGEPADAGTLARIRQELNAWRYIERLIEQLDPSGGRVDAGGGEGAAGE